MSKVRFGWLLAAAFASALVPHAAKADLIYGIDDNNRIVEVNTITQTSKAVFNTGLVGQSNAFAYDESRAQFWFLDPSKNLTLWDGGATIQQISSSAVIGGTRQPANAAFFNGAYWYFGDGTTTLNRIPFDYTSPVPVALAKEVFNVTGLTSPSTQNLFGDIAIDADGVLFGATTTGRFFKVDLADPILSTYAATIVLAEGVNPSLQLSFSSDFSKLYGQSFADAQWYEVDTVSGVASVIPGFVATPGLRDLGGAGAVPIPGPLSLAGAAMGFAWSRQLRRRIESRNRR